MPVTGDHAIVVGGSMAGLFAARALHEHFDRVTVFDRDPLLEALPPKVSGADHLTAFARQRRGTPQAFHVHALIYGSRICLDDLYAGVFTAAMRSAGARYLDMARDHSILTAGGWVMRHAGDLTSLYATRYTTESVVRGLTSELPNVDLQQGLVTGLLSDPKARSATGVSYRSDGGEATLEADLVVDASGRGSRAPAWVESLGYQPPPESLVHSHLAYATVYCRIPEGAWPGDMISLTATPIPGTTRGVSFNPQEDGLYGLMAIGQSRDYPPNDTAGFTEFLRTAITPVPYEIWREAEQLTDIHTTKTSVNRLRRWHEVAQIPDRFIVLGDAMAAFNPAYGQGITTASLNARTLRDRLRATDTPSAACAGIQSELANNGQLAWFIATQSDMSFEGAVIKDVDPTPPETDQLFSKLRQVATQDRVVAAAFLRAIMSLDATPLSDAELLARVAAFPERPLPAIADLARPSKHAVFDSAEAETKVIA